MNELNLYKLPNIQLVERYENLKPTAKQETEVAESEEIVKTNVEQVVAYLGSENLFSRDALTSIFALTQKHMKAPGLVFSRTRNSSASHSFIYLNSETSRQLFLSKSARVYPSPDEPIAPPFRRINSFLAMKIGPEGHVDELEEAVKIFCHFDPAAERMQKQIAIMNHVQSKYTPHTYATLQYEGNKSRIVAIMQKRIPKDLHDYYNATRFFRNIPRPLAYEVARGCVTAVQSLHKKKIVHGDLKLDNFLIEVTGQSARVYITDFGLSRHISDKSLDRCFYGTYAWAAPELIEKFEDPSIQGTLDQKCELWSLGQILHCLSGFAHVSLRQLTKIAELQGDARKESLQKWRTLLASPEVSPQCKIPELKAIAEKLLQVDPEKRIALDEVLQLLKSRRRGR